MSHRRSLLTVAFLLAACSGGGGDDDDTKRRDAGIPRDAGTRDTGVRDGGATVHDAGVSIDAGTIDSGVSRDGGAPTPDAGPRDGGSPGQVCWSADINVDGIVDSADETLRAGEHGWMTGLRGGNFADLDRDGDVDLDDGVCITEQMGGPGQGEILLEPSDTAIRAFGRYVAIDDDTLLVASNTRVFVYREGPSGWALEQELVPPMGEEIFQFPRIALDGDTAVIGDHAALFVYERAGTTWTFDAKLEPGRPAAYFGIVVALEGDRIVAGSLRATASVFERTMSGWFETPLEPSMRTQDFGTRLALSGDTVLVGENTGGNVFVFRRDADGNWPETQMLTSPTPTITMFGQGVAIENDLAVISAIEGSNYVSLGYTLDASGQLVGDSRASVAGVSPVIDGRRLFVGAFNSAFVSARIGPRWGHAFGVRVVTGHHQSPTQLDAQQDRVVLGLPRVAVQGNSGGVDDNPGAVLIVDLQ